MRVRASFKKIKIMKRTLYDCESKLSVWRVYINLTLGYLKALVKLRLCRVLPLYYTDRAFITTPVPVQGCTVALIVFYDGDQPTNFILLFFFLETKTVIRTGMYWRIPQRIVDFVQVYIVVFFFFSIFHW